MSNQQDPQITVDVLSVAEEVSTDAPSILLIGQGGDANTNKKLTENLDMRNAKDILDGDSMVYRAFERIRLHNKITPVDAVTLLEPAGKKAEAAIGITGTATDDGTVRFKIADANYRFEVSISKLDSSDQIATKMQAVVDKADVPYLAVAELNPSKLKLTYNINGTMGNGLAIELTSDVPGVDFTWTEFSGGEAEYNYEGVFKKLTKRYQFVVYDSTIKTADVLAFLEPRFNVENGIMAGNAVTMINAPLGGFQSISTEIRSRYSGSTMSIFANPDEGKYTAIPILAAAEFAAKSALLLTEGARLTGVYVQTSSEPVVGGRHMASLPYSNMDMSYDLPKGVLDITEINKLYDLGFSAMVIDAKKKSAVIGRMNTFNNTKSVFKTLNGVQTALVSREFLRNWLFSAFSRTRFVGGDTSVGPDMATEGLIRMELGLAYSELIQDQLVRGDSDAVNAFKKSITIVFDAPKMIAHISMFIPIVQQLRGLNAGVRYGFNLPI